MGMINRKDSAYKRKLWFNALLEKDLCSSVSMINASYQWKKPSFMFSFSAKNGAIRLGVNLNCQDDGLLLPDGGGPELAIRFRAYFISNYIHCLEAVRNANPQSFFNGLVHLEAINSLTGKNVDVYSPLSKASTAFRPIDAYCAVRAFTRLRLECGSRMPEEVRQYCDAQVNAFIVYSQLPEIEYHDGIPVYSLQAALKKLHRGLSEGTITPQQYALFSENHMCSFEELPLNRFIEACDASGNSFWAGAALRLAAFSGMRLDASFLQNSPSVCGHAAVFQNACTEYAKEYRGYPTKLITDNFDAIKRLAQRVERTVSGTLANSGALHFIQ